MSTAHCYLRVSTDEQAAEGYSLQAQERACRLYCDIHGYTGERVKLYCDEGYSGTKEDRPGLVQLLANVQPGDLVIVHQLDRLARNTALLLTVANRFERERISLVSVREQLDLSSPAGKIMLSMLAAFAQYYVDNLRVETAKGHREKARQGLWVGPVPYGYRKLDKGRLVPSADADTVRHIFRRYLQGASYVVIVDELNRAGVQAYDWKKRERHEFTRETVRTILRNRAYCGYVSSGGLEYSGTHEALVSEAVWEAAAARRAEQSTHSGPRAPRARGLEAGLLYCARCAAPLWFKTSGQASRAYYCSGRRAGCRAVASRAELVEEQLAEMAALAGAELESLDRVFVAVFVEEGEIVGVDVRAQFARLAALAGWTIRQQVNGEDDKRPTVTP